MENYEAYQKIVNDIIDRTNGSYDLMSFEDKIKMVTIMKDIKEYIDNYLVEQYPIVCAWAGLNMTDIVLQETQPRLDFTREFNKLMGV